MSIMQDFWSEFVGDYMDVELTEDNIPLVMNRCVQLGHKYSRATCTDINKLKQELWKYHSKHLYHTSLTRLVKRKSYVEHQIKQEHDEKDRLHMDDVLDEFLDMFENIHGAVDDDIRFIYEGIPIYDPEHEGLEYGVDDMIMDELHMRI